MELKKITEKYLNGYTEAFLVPEKNEDFDKIINLLFDNYINAYKQGANAIDIVTLKEDANGINAGTKLLYLTGEYGPISNYARLFCKVNEFNRVANSDMLQVLNDNPVLVDCKVIPVQEFPSSIFEKPDKAEHYAFFDYWLNINNKTENDLEYLSLLKDLTIDKIAVYEKINQNTNNLYIKEEALIKKNLENIVQKLNIK